jgi:steroid 5-alpha reductase family enzyme
MKLTLSLVIIWALRLSIHIGLRHKGEDYRYKIIKKRWSGCSKGGRLLAAYLYIFGMQGLFSMINNGAAIFVMRHSVADQELGLWEYIGASVWFIGFLMEVVSDY